MVEKVMRALFEAVFATGFTRGTALINELSSQLAMHVIALKLFLCLEEHGNH